MRFECLLQFFQAGFFYVISAAKYLNNEMVISFRAILAFYEANDDQAREIYDLLEAIPPRM